MADSEVEPKPVKLPNKWAVGFTVVIALLAALTHPFAGGGPDPPSICLVTCTLSLGSMIAVWCAVLGGWKAYLVGSIAIVIDGVALLAMGGPDWSPTLLPLAVALPSCLTLELIKALFGKFSKVLAGDLEFQEGLQFKLTHLFITTTVIAVVCGIGQAVSQFVSFDYFDSRFLQTLITISVVLGLNTLLCVWAILGKGMWWRLSIAVPVAIGLISVGVYLMRSHAGLWAIIFVICFCSTSILIGLLRHEGYRFVRKPNV